MELQQIFDRLWKDYTEQNSSPKKVYDLFHSEGEQVLNDHIAFRTFNDPRINIDELSRPFIKNGYVEKGQYNFDKKHLFAKHFEIPGEEKLPRVFISQLKLEVFSPFLQHTIKGVLENIPENMLKSENLIFSGNLWGKPSYEIYEKLRQESEYAAWLYVFGFRANHFTVSVNSLKKYTSLEAVNQLLKDNGLRMNDSGGEIKGTPEQLLQQSSIMADHTIVDFTEGQYNIPACYYEFAMRYPDKNGKLFSGFIAKSADKIFESTDYYNK